MLGGLLSKFDLRARSWVLWACGAQHVFRDGVPVVELDELLLLAVRSRSGYPCARRQALMVEVDTPGKVLAIASGTALRRMEGTPTLLFRSPRPRGSLA